MSEVITVDQTLRIKAMEICVALFSALPDSDVEDFEGMANNIYEFIKGDTNE
jgi:hypothetical protein